MRVFNFIRGCDPQPGATTTFRGEKVKLYNANFVRYQPDAEPATPGEIIQVARKFRRIAIAVAGGAIWVSRFRTKELGKVKAPEFIAAKQPQVLALKWHAYLWDPWFLIWGLFVFLALWRSRAGWPEPLTMKMSSSPPADSNAAA